jgi:hypothetical protein
MSQLAQYEALRELSAEQHEVLWGSGTFYRVFSTVNSGRAKEADLFAGVLIGWRTIRSTGSECHQ